MRQRATDERRQYRQHQVDDKLQIIHASMLLMRPLEIELLAPGVILRSEPVGARKCATNRATGENSSNTGVSSMPTPVTS